MDDSIMNNLYVKKHDVYVDQNNNKISAFYGAENNMINVSEILIKNFKKMT